MSEANLGIVEFYLGDFIDEVVMKYGYPLDFEEEYDLLLKYIYKSIVKAFFSGQEPTPEGLEKKLKNLRRSHRAKLEVLLSYLVAKFVNRVEEEALSRVRSGKKRE